MSSIDASTVGSLSQSPSPIRSARSSPPASSRAPSAASIDAPTPAASSRASTPISTPPRRRPPTTPSASPLTTPDDSPVRPPADSPITTPANSAQQSPQQSPVRESVSPARDGAAPAPVSSVGSDGSPHSTGLPDVSSVHVARGGGEPSAVDPTAGSLSPSSSVHHKTTTSAGQDGPQGGALQDTTGTLGDIGTSSIAMPSAHSDPSFSVSAATADHLPPPAPAHAHSASAAQHSTSGSRHRSASGAQGHSSQRLSLSSAFGTGAASIVRGPDGVLRDNAPDFGGCFGGIAPHYVPLEPRMAESPAAWRPDASPRDLGAGRSLFGGASPVRDQHHPHGSTALSFSPQSAGRGRDAEHLPGSTALSPVPAAPGSGAGAELHGASISGSHAQTSGSRVSASGVRVSVVHGFEVADYSSSEHSWSGDEVTGSPSRGPPPRIERDPSLQRGFTAAPIAADGGAPADALLSPRWSPTGAATPNRPPLHPTTAATGTGSVSSTATPHRPAPTPSPHHAASLYGRAELAEYPSTPLAQRSGTAGHGTPESAQRQSLLLPAAANASPMRAQLGTTCDGGLTAVLPEASPSQHSQHSPVYAGAHPVPAVAAPAPIPAPGAYDRPLGHHGRGDSIGSPSYASPYYAGGSAGLPSAGLPSASFSRQAAEIVSALSDHHDHHASRHTHSGTQHSAASLLGVSPVLAARHGSATATGSSASRTDSGRARVRSFPSDAASPTRQPAPAPAPVEAGPRDANVIGLLEDFIRALRQDERMGAAAAAARGEYAPPAPLASPPPASYDLPPPPLPPLPPLPGQRGPEAYAPHGAVPAALLQPPAPTHGCELDAVGDFAYYAPGLGKRQGPAAVVGRSYGASLSSYGTAEAALRSDPAVHGVYPGGLSGEAAPRLSSFDRVLLAQARARWGASPYAAHC